MPQTIRSSAAQSQWLAPVVLIVCTLLAMGKVSRHEFTAWDDPFNIWQNPRLNPPSFGGVAYYWTCPMYGLYIPLTYTAWGVLAWGARVEADPQGLSLNPWVFHSANLAVHVLSVLVVFGILRILIRDRRAACVGAMLFGLHPVQVEAVAWAAGLKDVLSGMLGLVAIWQYLVFAAENRGRKPFVQSGLAAYCLATLALILAMLAKPSAMMVPVMAAAIDLGLLRRPPRRVALALVTWFAVAVACAIMAKVVQPGTGVTPVPLWARPFVAADALAFYLHKLVWPAQLGIDYGRRPPALLGHWWFYVTWIVPALLGLILVLNRKRMAEVLVGAVIFVAGVAPVLGLTTFLFQHYSTTADHYLYTSMLGAALAAAWVVKRYARPGLFAAAAIVLAALGVRTMFQADVWRDSVSLFTHSLTVNPNSFVVANNLGYVYSTQQRPDLAEPLFRRAIALKSDYWEAHKNLADILKAPQQLDEAIIHRKRALFIMLERPPQIRPDPLPLVNELITDLITARRLDEARQFLQIALKLGPNDPQTRRNIELLEKQQTDSSTKPAGS